MRKLVKKYTGFLAWVLIPSLLLMASVLGVNFISRPASSLYGSFDITAPCNNKVDPDSTCNANAPNCVIEFCNSNATTAFCDISAFDTAGTCGQCYTAGNGRCEAAIGEDSANTPEDCIKGGSATQLNQTCFLVSGAPITACGAELENPNGSLGDAVPALDGCCPAGCQGLNPGGPNFDGDCCEQCGDGFFNSLIEECGETGAPACPSGQVCSNCQCVPSCGNGQLDAGEQCDPQSSTNNCPTGQTCNPTTCQCSGVQPPVCGDGVLDPGEDCEGTTCDFTNTDGTIIPGVCQACVCIPECQTEGSGCGDDGTNGSGVCFSGTGGSSLIPVGIHAGVLAQWLAAFAIPGAAFVGVKVRRRFKK